MAIADCNTCKQLMEDASKAISRHLEAVSAVTSRVEHGRSTTRASRQLEERSLERENAVARYESHLATHEAQPMRAGAGGA